MCLENSSIIKIIKTDLRKIDCENFNFYEITSFYLIKLDYILLTSETVLYQWRRLLNLIDLYSAFFEKRINYKYIFLIKCLKM